MDSEKWIKKNIFPMIDVMTAEFRDVANKAIRDKIDLSPDDVLFIILVNNISIFLQLTNATSHEEVVNTLSELLDDDRLNRAVIKTMAKVRSIRSQAKLQEQVANLFKTPT